MPPAASRELLVVAFPEPMDHALTLRLLTVVNATGQRVTGRAVMEEHEQRWRFTPNAAWLRGRYDLVIQTTVEDLAGNHIGKPFEVDLFTGVERHLTTSSVKLSFEVR